MTSEKQIFLCVLFTYLSLCAVAQETIAGKAKLAIEARTTTYLQGGYDIALFYYPKGIRFSFGIMLAGHPIRGNAKELIFHSGNYDNLTMRLSWITSFQTRYHFVSHKEGLFGEAGMGIEEFRITAGNESHNNRNGFIAPAIGYIWYPWQRNGFYLMPKVAGVFILFREDEQRIQHTSYQLKSFFPSPSIAIGWKF